MRPFMCLEMRALSVDFLAPRVITPVHLSPLEALVVRRAGHGHGSIEQGWTVSGQQGHAGEQAAGPVDQRRSTLLKVLLHMRDGSGERERDRYNTKTNTWKKRDAENRDVQNRDM